MRSTRAASRSPLAASFAAGLLDQPVRPGISELGRASAQRVAEAVIIAVNAGDSLPVTGTAKADELKALANRLTGLSS